MEKGNWFLLKSGDKNMITFNGTQKEFFKEYPKGKRSLEETYKLINSTGEIEYKFIGGLGEKCFKKVDTTNSKNTTNKSDVECLINEIKNLKEAVDSLASENKKMQDEITKLKKQTSKGSREDFANRIITHVKEHLLEDRPYFNQLLRRAGGWVDLRGCGYTRDVHFGSKYGW